MIIMTIVSLIFGISFVFISLNKFWRLALNFTLISRHECDCIWLTICSIDHREKSPRSSAKKLMVDNCSFRRLSTFYKSSHHLDSHMTHSGNLNIEWLSRVYSWNQVRLSKRVLRQALTFYGHWSPFNNRLIISSLKTNFDVRFQGLRHTLLKQCLRPPGDNHLWHKLSNIERKLATGVRVH